jgi:flagellar biosynthesis GTPase FlhF
MRTQKGATSLRALLYMDEIFGYLPPQRNPASKQPLLRMLKQARAFGLGLLLATQNPVDVDYKALSNAGTWFIGKLQTEQDKDRLLDGLESAAGGVTRNVFDKLISSLGKRVFVLHNVHAKQPVLLQSRWTMNYLAGPLTRTQIPALNKLANADAAIQTLPKTASVSMDDSPSKSDQPSLISSTIKTLSIEGSLTKPPVPSGVKEYFLPQNLSLPEAFKAAGQTMSPETTLAGVVYRPALIASAQVRILDRKLGVDSERTRAALVESLDKGGIVRWDEHLFNSQMLEQTETSPAPSSRFGTIDAPLTDPKLFSTLQKDFADWVFRNSSVQARANDALKVYAGPDVNRAEFMKACADAASQKRDAEIEKESAKFDRQLQTLENKKSREERELKMDQQDLEGRKREANSNLLEIGASVIGIGRKRSITSQFSKNRLTNKARADVEESIDAIKEFDKQIAEIQKLREEAIAEIKDRWGHVVNDITEVTVTPKKTDVFVDLFGIAWRPCYVVRSGEGTIEVPAFGEE